MSLVLSNIKELLKSLRDNDWYITAFDFSYNGYETRSRGNYGIKCREK